MAAQASSESPAEAFFEKIDVAIVNVDVWVTDKDGDPVDGLDKEDFVVYRDGQPVEITNFYAVAGGRPAPLGARRLEPVPPAEEDSRSDGLERFSGELEVAPEHRLWLVVYIDNYNIDPLERNRIFPALRAFLQQTLGRGDQAMLVTSTRSPEVVKPFTGDGGSLADALAEVVDDVGHALVRKRDQVATLRRIDEARGASQALAYAQQYAEEQMNAVEYTVRALESLIESLAGLSGRKALVHVSSGVPMAAGEEMFHVVAEKFDTSQPYSMIPRYDTSRRFERIIRLANTHRVVFYTLDAGGLRGMEFGKAEYGGFVDPRMRTTLDSIVPESLQAPLHLMAVGTGGRAIVNQNEILPALSRAAQDFRSFYSLGIASTADDRDRYHDIEVKLAGRRRGLRLRHREGYRSRTLETRVRDSLRSALLYAQNSNPGNVDVTWGRAERQDDGTYLLPIRLTIPLESLVLLPTMTGKHEARLRLYFGAAGPDGEASTIQSLPLGFRLADEHVQAAMGEALVHTHKLLVDPGPRRVGVAIVDLAGGQPSVLTRSLRIGSSE